MTAGRVVRYCGACGAPRQSGGRFCGGCGAPFLGDPGTSLGPPPAAPGPGRPPLDLAALSPITLLRDRTLWRPPVVAFAAAAITPFVLVQYGNDPAHFTEVAWGFAAYFAAVWFLILQSLIRPQPVPWAHLAGVAGFTLVVGVGFAMWAEAHLGGPDNEVVGWTVAVGLPEEVAKLLGVLVVVHVVGASYTPRTFLFLGAVSGLAFGTAEAVLYAGRYTESGSGYPKELVVVAVWRLVAGGLLHACLAGITAFFLGLARQRARQFTALVVTGLLIAGVLHGIYDAAAYAQDALVVLVFAGVLATFIAYAERGEQVLARLPGPPPLPPPPALPAEAP